MNRIFGLIRASARALLIFIVVTAMFGVVYWLIERRSINDLVGAGLVACGWFAIAFLMWKRGWPRDDAEW
ncbi:hypothetical protein [Burkholderia cenocepacia]|uniref:hypothetical protein n=1 Tax=Burkholderia cenocepacia TaxID=95486 RepID=UPI00223217A9|nr:hypothetical protein [Burkholderia cenocepacia]MCW3609180.1 hypothetical protein [Burkholderia cenocepacia]MCW5189905.1 hypothetical protein [Burkholderia cenocepacia]